MVNIRKLETELREVADFRRVDSNVTFSLGLRI